jgi:hypothetical protein
VVGAGTDPSNIGTSPGYATTVKLGRWIAVAFDAIG